MPHDNVEIIRGIYRAFNERRLEDIMPWCDEDVEWHQVGPFPDAQVYRGRDQLGALFGMFLETFDDFQFDVDRLLDSGDHVAVIGTARGHGASGLDLETGFVHLCRLRDGKVVWGYDCAGPPRSF
jgi:uncharacterized protein